MGADADEHGGRRECGWEQMRTRMGAETDADGGRCECTLPRVR